MDSVNGDKEIMDLLKNNYQSLYNGVPTSDTELADLERIINKGINTELVQNIVMTPDIVAQSILQLKIGTDDGNQGFKSDHVTNGRHHLHVWLSILFNAMLSHGYNEKYLLIPYILSIPKDSNHLLVILNRVICAQMGRNPKQIAIVINYILNESS